MDQQRERAGKVNKLLEVIASCGRRFFAYPQRYGVSRFEVDRRGRIWFIDGYTGRRIYLHYRNWGRGFSEGGTLRDLVNSLKRYIATGEPAKASFGPWPQWLSDGDPWGYGEDMQQVRECAAGLGITGRERITAGKR